MKRKQSLVEAVHEIVGLLSSVIDEDEAVRRTLAAAIEATDSEGGSVLLHEPAGRVLRFRHVVGRMAERLAGFAISESDGIAGKVFGTGEPQISNKVAGDPDHCAQVDREFSYETRSVCTVPLRYPGGETIGVLQLVNKRDGGFGQDDLMVLDIVASIAAMCILNAELASQAQSAAALACLGDLAHDIKNKMAPIVMGAQTLQMLLQDETDASAVDSDGATECIAASLSAVVDGAAEVQRYTKFIADAAKGKAIEPEMRQGDLASVVERQVATLVPLARQRDVTLHCCVIERPEPVFDRFLIERAVFNLVNNAVPETPPGGSIEVRVGADASCAAIDVIDTGRGMPRHILESILHGRAISTKPGGTGLGSSIVKKMIEAQGGRFEGESKAGSGTRFRLTLPLSR